MGSCCCCCCLILPVFNLLYDRQSRAEGMNYTGPANRTDSGSLHILSCVFGWHHAANCWECYQLAPLPCQSSPGISLSWWELLGQLSWLLPRERLSPTSGPCGNMKFHLFFPTPDTYAALSQPEVHIRFMGIFCCDHIRTQCFPLPRLVSSLFLQVSITNSSILNDISLFTS